MRRRKSQEAEQLREQIDQAIKNIKEYGYQDMYSDVMQGNHYGFIAVVDAIDIIEKAMRDPSSTTTHLKDT